MREREGERKNYVRENVIECTHTSKHFCMNSLVNNFEYNSCVSETSNNVVKLVATAWKIVTYLIEQVCLPC